MPGYCKEMHVFLTVRTKGRRLRTADHSTTLMTIKFITTDAPNVCTYVDRHYFYTAIVLYDGVTSQVKVDLRQGIPHLGAPVVVNFIAFSYGDHKKKTFRHLVPPHNGNGHFFYLLLLLLLLLLRLVMQDWEKVIDTLSVRTTAPKYQPIEGKKTKRRP